MSEMESAGEKGNENWERKVIEKLARSSSAERASFSMTWRSQFSFPFSPADSISDIDQDRKSVV